MTMPPRRLPEIRTRGDEIRRLRVARAWSQTRLADVATGLYPSGHALRYSVSLSSVKRAEAGGPVLWPTARALAEALDVDPARVLADGEIARVGLEAPTWDVELDASQPRPASVLQIQTRLQCLAIYRQIVFDQRAAVLRGELGAERYWGSLFFHLYDQHQFWLDDAIDDRTYAVWLRKRAWDWELNEEVGGLALRDAWHTWSARIGEPEFAEAMESAFRGDVRAAMAGKIDVVPGAPEERPNRPPPLRVRPSRPIHERTGDD